MLLNVGNNRVFCIVLNVNSGWKSLRVYFSFQHGTCWVSHVRLDCRGRRLFCFEIMYVDSAAAVQFCNVYCITSKIAGVI